MCNFNYCFMVYKVIICNAIVLFSCIYRVNTATVAPVKSLIWGPGLLADDLVMPARYFYIQTVDENNNSLSESPGNIFNVTLSGQSDQNSKGCRLWVNTLDRKDGSFIIRYKLYQTCYNFEISIKYQEDHVAESPYKMKDPVYAEECYCPVESIAKWTEQYQCKTEYPQIDSDLKPFSSVNFSAILNGAKETFLENSGSMSVCNYIIKDNQVYRECFGKYVGFNMFIDAILLSLARKVLLPDMEMFFNLGDWPLVKTNGKMKIPMFSWCGSNDTLDIVMPTYDITEASLQCMGRVMLDMLSVQGNIDKKWSEKIEKAFWRGRDSRRERLDLIDIARKHPDLFNASLTNFFFFRDEEDVYGPKEKHVSFFKFFDYKYQINIDGTVAAYRFPYLLVGDSLVFKQESNYYEFFYNELEPWTHYIPVQSDLSDLVAKITWAKQNDDIAQDISRNARAFAQDNLMPQDVFCYHAVLFKEWSKRLVNKVQLRETLEHIPQPDAPCRCHRSQASDVKQEHRDEL